MYCQHFGDTVYTRLKVCSAYKSEVLSGANFGEFIDVTVLIFASPNYVSKVHDLGAVKNLNICRASKSEP